MTNFKPKKHRIAQFFAIRQILGFSVSPNGKKIVYITNTDGLPNIWTIPIDGGWASQITLSEQAVKMVDYSPKNNLVFFQSDFNGNENMQIYSISDNGGDIKYLTPGHGNSQVHLSAFNKKGSKILFGSNKRDPKYFDTYVYDLKSEKEECIRTTDSIYAEMSTDWSRNGRYILYDRYYNNSNQDIILYDRQSGTIKNITEHKGSMKNYSGVFNKKNDKVYFISDYSKEFSSIACYNMKTGALTWEVEDKWDITSFKFSESEKFLIFSVNENGNTKLKKKNVKTGEIKSLRIPAGNINVFSITPDDKKIVFLYDGPQNPNDIFVYDLKSGKSKQITFSMIGGIPKHDFIKPSLIKYKSFDGIEISAFLYLPKGIKKDGTNPAIVWPHGGPEWQEKNLFNKFLQILTNRGYIIIAPNFRGSTGYGKTFQQKIYKDWGGAEFKDVLEARGYLVSEGYADKNNISVVGGSFGGFMVLTCVTKAPDLWRCAIDIFGPSNLLTFLDWVPEHWKPATAELVGHPVHDRKLLIDRSPINFVDNIKCPLFVIQGLHDPRVVKAESDQIVEKLRAQNKEVEYFVFEDEGHGFMKVSNQIKSWQMIVDFLDKHTK
jgi:dipeptidyl aminopeptidase/acylaminoacyl peptidase